MKRRSKRDSRRTRPVKARAALVTSLVLLALLTVPARLVWLSCASARRLALDRASTLKYARWLPEMRGTITDRSGVVLAQTTLVEGKKVRIYPCGPSVSTTVGITSPLAGELGVERFLTYQGVPASEDPPAVESLLLGDPLFCLDRTPDAELTLDAHLSQEIYNLFAVRKQPGLAVLMTTDGDILSMVSYPAFDPGPLLEPGDTAYRQFVNTHAGLYELNRCLSPIPIASTMKPFLWLAYAEQFGHFPGAGVVCRGSVVLRGEQIRCHARHWTLHSWSDGILKSCDVAAACTVDACSGSHLAEFFQRLGLADTPVDGIAAPPGQMQAPFQSPAQQLQLALGSSVAFSPVAVARAYAAIFRRGQLPQARILRRMAGRQLRAELPVQVLSASRSDEMAAALRAVVTRGTARNIRRTPLAGKTGTITLPGEHENAGLFAWGAPYPRCQVVGLVVLDQVTPAPAELHGFEGHDAAVYAAQIYELYRKSRNGAPVDSALEATNDGRTG